MLTVPYPSQDMPLPPQVVGGQAEYRSALAASFLFKFYVFVCHELQIKHSVRTYLPTLLLRMHQRY